jgi:hypothetical protein
MAGILFTDGNLVLCGYSIHKTQITGIGGKKKENEELIETAIRETIEELFELETIPEALTRFLKTRLTFNTIIGVPNYTVFVMTFQDLDIIFETLKMFSVKSNIYSIIPVSITDLLFMRKVNQKSELSTLCLLPCVNKITISSSLLNDIYAFKNCII